MHEGAGAIEGPQCRPSDAELSGDSDGHVESDSAGAVGLPDGCQPGPADLSEGELVVDPSGAPGAGSDAPSTAESDAPSDSSQEAVPPDEGSGMHTNGPEREWGSDGAARDSSADAEANTGACEDPLGALVLSALHTVVYNWVAYRCDSGGICTMSESLPLLQLWWMSWITHPRNISTLFGRPPQMWTISLFGR